MILKPSNVADLSQQLAAAHSRNEKVERVEMSALNRVVQHTAEDMTVTVQAGITLAALQTELARHNQWLPIDPPHDEAVTISEIINQNLSGPRRCGFGTIRDHLLGIEVALADGTLIHSGGKVVKNVAGYDLLKLFIGSRDSLGVVTETTFKLRPLPELERFTQTQCASLELADECLEALAKSALTPVVVDLFQLLPAAPLTIVLGFAGCREEVEWQLALAVELGFKQPGSLAHDAEFWKNPTSANHGSVLPSRLTQALRVLNGAPFVARAGNGVIYHRGPATLSADKLPRELMQRLKDAYDPKHIFPGLPL